MFKRVSADPSTGGQQPSGLGKSLSCGHGGNHGRLSSFSFPISLRSKKVLPAVLLGVVYGVAFASIGWFVVGNSDWFDRVLKVIFIGSGSAALCYGLWLLMKYLEARHEELRVEGNETEIAIRTFKHGRVCRERSFSRHIVSGARSSDAGDTRGKFMKITLVVGGNTEEVAYWVSADIADEVVHRINSALG